MNLTFFSQMFAIGLVTSIHCVFMCGGLVLTYAVKGTETGSWYRKLVPHLAYQGSKIVSYATVALILGSLVLLAGKAVDITPIRNWAPVVAGVYMVLLGIGMTGKVPVLRYLTPRPPKFLVDALSKNRKKAVHDAEEGHASLATPIMFGLLTGLMPCAPLIAAQASAVSQGGGLFTGVLGMVGFGLGTMPLMLVFGFASSLLSRQFQNKMQIIAAIAVVLFGLYIFNNGLRLVGSPVTFDTVRSAVLGNDTDGVAGGGFTKGADGVVEVSLGIVNTQYVPETLSIPANVRVRLIVNRQEDNACSDQLVINAANVKANLTPNGVTKVDLPAMPAGSYQMTCGMGMMSGTLVVGGSAPTNGGTPPLAVPAALLVLVGGGWALFHWRARQRMIAQTEAGALRKPGAGGKGTSNPKGASSKRQAAALTGSDRLLGFQPLELFIGAVLVILAIVIGLTAGGFFR